MKPHFAASTACMLVLGCAALSAPSQAQTPAPAPASAYVDQSGTIRWRKDDREVRLFGANYCAYAGSDYRMLGLVKADRKAAIDRDMAHFARMGWDGMRICTWGDWEHSDGDGNLVANDHLDLMDYAIARAAERGIKMLLTPTHTYNPGYADQLDNPDYRPGGFSSRFPREALVTDPEAIAAQKRYIAQLLDHVNPYTGKALKDHANIVFVELINEPVHNSKDLAQSVSYIDGLVETVRATGAKQITFHNISQDFGIADAILKSKVDGVSFGWYPSGLVSGYEQKGNFLPSVRDYAPMRDPRIAKLPRIVYEFDQGDLNTGYLLPAMARSYRAVGAQFAAIFAYDELETAPYNLSWQTHFINLVHTPRQAMSAVIAGEAMDRLSVEQAAAAPDGARFGDFWVDYDNDASGLAASDAYMNAGDSTVAPKAPRTLRRIAGVGSSPLIAYEGTGAYFLDKVADGVWRLEVYPDQVQVADPFEQPRPDKIVSRLYSRAWSMKVALPDLGNAFHVRPVRVPGEPAAASRASNRRFTVRPGIWLLSASGRSATLPPVINGVKFDEYHVNAPRTYTDMVLPLSASSFVAGKPAALKVRLAAAQLPPSITARIRSAGSGFGSPIELKRTHGDVYAAPVGDLAPGFYDFVVTTGGRTYPDNVAGQPGTWPFEARRSWRFSVTPASTPLNIFDPASDLARMAFPRLREDLRSPVFKLLPGETSADGALRLGVPQVDGGPSSYGTGLYIGDRVRTRGASAAKANRVAVRAKAETGRKALEIVLIEKDGSSWAGKVVTSDRWQTYEVPLDTLTFSRSMLLPTPFPGLWNYWRTGPADRSSTRIRPDQIERIELRIGKDSAEGDAILIGGADLLYPPER